jgi:hypothetical protein
MHPLSSNVRLKEKQTCVSRFDFLSALVFLLSRHRNRMYSGLNVFCIGLLDNFCLILQMWSGK